MVNFQPMHCTDWDDIRAHYERNVYNAGDHVRGFAFLFELVVLDHMAIYLTGEKYLRHNLIRGLLWVVLYVFTHV